MVVVFFRFTPLVILLVACNPAAEPEKDALAAPRPELPALPDAPHAHVNTNQSSAAPNNARTTFEPTEKWPGDAPHSAPDGMVWIPPGEFSMGSLDPQAQGHCHEPMDDARPIHRVRLSGFFMDKTEVTNRDYQLFVDATGYVTLAERIPTEQEMPGVPQELRLKGSNVFSPTVSQAAQRKPLGWWQFVQGADWRHPAGPRSNLDGKAEHPVVHVSHEDALAYARWAGKDLPTEAEWEYAARGGETGKLYPWGDEFAPRGKAMANTFQGKFPWENTAQDGFVTTAPVASFAPNSYGLFDVAGNVWEWTGDWYRADTYDEQAQQSVNFDPQGPLSSFDPQEPGTPKRVQRGGSFLCASEYCSRYMVGTRGKAEPNSPASHIGFRCVKRKERLPLDAL